ncbi:MAG: DUF2066 domain-containing protein [Deltaproteobacteria bacterium]|nr:DUF2066 domain-containing protein [Deltaproteobacteria bacterium]
MGHQKNSGGRSAVRLRGNALFLFFLSFSLFFLPFCRAQAEETPKPGELLAIGDADVIKGNSALAKKTAIAQALMKGVEDYIVHLLGSRRAVSHFERLAQEIIPAAREEVENFHILAEQQSDGRYKVLLRLRVNEEAIREQLQSAGVLLAEASPINVLFLVSESRDGDISYWWKDTEKDPSLRPVELALHKVFQNRGFTPVNRILSAPDAGRLTGLTSPDLQDKDILKWGRLFSADVVVFGNCTVNNGEEISLTLKAIDVSQGIQVCQESIADQMTAASRGSDSLVTALEEVVNRAAATFCPCIKGSFVSGGGGILPLTVTLAGMKMPKEFWRFSDFLKEEVVGVISVIPSRIQGNTMSATVEFQGDRDTFIHRILTHPKRPFPLRFDPIEQEAVIFNLE